MTLKESIYRAAIQRPPTAEEILWTLRRSVERTLDARPEDGEAERFERAYEAELTLVRRR